MMAETGCYRGKWDLTALEELHTKPNPWEPHNASLPRPQWDTLEATLQKERRLPSWCSRCAGLISSVHGLIPGNTKLRPPVGIDVCCLCRDIRAALAEGKCCADGLQSHGDPGHSLPSGGRIQSADQQRDAPGRGRLRVPDQRRWQPRPDTHCRNTWWVKFTEDMLPKNPIINVFVCVRI